MRYLDPSYVLDKMKSIAAFKCPLFSGVFFLVSLVWPCNKFCLLVCYNSYVTNQIPSIHSDALRTHTERAATVVHSRRDAWDGARTLCLTHTHTHHSSWEIFQPTAEFQNAPEEKRSRKMAQLRISIDVNLNQKREPIMHLSQYHFPWPLLRPFHPAEGEDYGTL